MNISEEIIDSYVREDLKDAELASFEKTIESNPTLQKEVSFQKEIVYSVQQLRHQQLKSRLNAIEIKPAGFLSSTSSKVAASALLIALFIGSYFVYNNTETLQSMDFTTKNATSNQALDSSYIASAKTINSISVVESNLNTTSKSLGNVPSISTEVINSNNLDVQKANKKTSLKATKEASQASTSYESLSDQEIDSDNMNYGIKEDFNMPTINTGGNIGNISSPQLKVNIVKENNLGYRFFNNQLFLHGNFSNSTYELLELNNMPTKKLYLFFENNFYELIQGKTKVTSLSPINDTTLLLQLNQLKNH